MVRSQLAFHLLCLVLATRAFAFGGDASRGGIAPDEETILGPSSKAFELKQQVVEASVARIIAEETGAPSQAGTVFAAEGKVAGKSRGRAFLQSLLLPGWGQHYAESPKMMRVFIASEVLLWGGFIGFTKWSDWLEDDYRAFAVEHARIDLQGKSDRYFSDISIFNGIDEFNQDQLRNRDVTTLYNDREADFWQWDSRGNRLQYANLRFRSNNADNRAELMLAAIFVNHLASAIHSTLSVFKFNKRLQKEEIGLHLDFQPSQSGQRVAVRLEKRF